jgi:very-short-patch-repair endonuclease
MGKKPRNQEEKQGALQAPHPHPNPPPSRGREQRNGEALGVLSPSPSTGEGRDGGDGNLARTQRDRTLRRNMTDAERRLWQGLRGRQMGGRKFRRQFPLGPYIVDFVCLEARLIIEVDGGQHLDSPKDKLRDAWLVAEGYRVLRFWNHEVRGETEVVLPHAKQCPAPSPSTGEGGDGGEVGCAVRHEPGQDRER